MKKVLVIGSPGAGKSTLAKTIGQKLNLPIVRLDHLWWQPGWIQRTEEEFDHLLEKELQKDKWIMDGNYNRTLPHRLQDADTVIHLDYNRFRCLWRIGKRVVVTREEQAPGCQSKADMEFLHYVGFKYPTKHRARTNELQKAHHHITWIRLSHPKQAAKFLASL